MIRHLIFCAVFVHVSSHLKAELPAALRDAAMSAATVLKEDAVTKTPGYSSHVPESGLNEIHALEAASERAIQNNPHAQMVTDMTEARPYFRLDGEKDGLLTTSNEVSNNADGYASGAVLSRKKHITYERKTCRESREKTEMTCSKILLEPSIHIEPEKYSHYWCTSGTHGPDDSRCKAKRYYNPARKYKDEIVTVTNENWTNGCQNLEKKEKKGICRRLKTVCPKGEESREVSGPLGNGGEVQTRIIKRPCWRYESTYQCDSPSENTCAVLRQSSCEQMASNCIRDVGGECIEWEQVYRCPKEVILEEPTATASSSAMQMPQQELHYEPNADMSDAIAKLSIFKEVQEQMGTNKDASSIRVFNGSAGRCTIAFAGFKNCCTNKGWSSSVGMNNCNSEDQELARLRQKGLCVEVGTYCAEKTLGVCVRKKRSSCCFPSKLSRILQEQGRVQLGLGWGDAKSPDCRGLTPEELSRINFDRLDLRDIYSDVQQRVKQISTRVVKRNVEGRINTMTQGLQNKTPTGDY